jgi:aryl-alcohol dehydrogenase-like predicted oxidoreductase
MKQRALGRNGLVTSAVGLGCAAMSEYYGPTDESESIRSVRRALETGVTLLDTADSYGRGENERLLARALAGREERPTVATKFGVRRNDRGEFRGVSGRPEYVREACDLSLRRLEVDCIDLYQQHRVDPATPIEETVGAMAELVRAGKIRHLGLCEVTPEEIRRAAAVTEIATVQCEYSLFDRTVEDGVLQTCEELGVGFLAYAPLGRGLLTGRFRTPSDFGPDDWRKSGYFPRFNAQNLPRNVQLLREVEEVAAERGASSSQLAIAWLLSRRAWIVPIPGTTRIQHLDENVAAADLQLSESELARLEGLLPEGGAASGAPYAPEHRPS